MVLIFILLGVLFQFICLFLFYFIYFFRLCAFVGILVGVPGFLGGVLGFLGVVRVLGGVPGFWVFGDFPGCSGVPVFVEVLHAFSFFTLLDAG